MDILKRSHRPLLSFFLPFPSLHNNLFPNFFNRRRITLSFPQPFSALLHATTTLLFLSCPPCSAPMACCCPCPVHLAAYCPLATVHCWDPSTCRGTIPGITDATPRVASVVASMASRVCGTWHTATLGASIDRQSYISASGGPLLRRPPLPFLEWIMFLATPQLVATLYFPAPHDTLYFPAPYDQLQAFFIAPCDEWRAEPRCRNITYYVEQSRRGIPANGLSCEK